ncbi:hypothetical protein [Rubellimicrobium aerolatum]|uniref:SGNH/GDSL hydrolase family protein n=1 Tax=Rubellimicrobium aerolatum TaxID=490979 RepID=A0ABW0SEV5_9RHOB|nr:hypothetical protein [Rubellimicrobium aerolatum]MBP1806448.1 hypothetical protein [Rubellimicrobium aerolatum]
MSRTNVYKIARDTGGNRTGETLAGRLTLSTGDSAFVAGRAAGFLATGDEIELRLEGAASAARVVPSSAAAPAQLAAGDWDLVDVPSPGGNTLGITILAWPDDGGSGLLSLRWRIGAGAVQTAAFPSPLPALPWTYPIPVLAGEAASVQVGVGNAVGDAPLSSAKTRTPTATADTRLDFPRIGLIGPSTMAHTTYGAVGSGTTPYRQGDSAVGPLTWALMSERIAEIRVRSEATGDYVSGDNQAVAGAIRADYAAQITALAAEMAAEPNWLAWYEVGRNDIGSTTSLASDLIAWTIEDVGKLLAAGAKAVLVSKMWNRSAWTSTSNNRAVIRDYNAWLEAWAAQNEATVGVVRNYDCLTDPASSIADPYGWVTRSDQTHYTTKGAMVAGREAVLPALRKFCKPRPYPARTPDSLIGAMSGTGGTKTRLTGVVADGWNAQLSGASSTTIAAQEVIDGETFQVFTISAASLVPANGNMLAFNLVSGFPLAEGRKVSGRARVIVGSTAIPYALWGSVGNTNQFGDMSQGRAYMLASQTDSSNPTTLIAPGPSWASVLKHDGTMPHDLWLESSAHVLGAAGGSSVGFVLGLLFGTAAQDSDTLTIKIGQIQTFDVP